MAAIDVGQDCSTLIYKGWNDYVIIQANNPANLTGTIDYCCVRSILTAMTNQKIGSFVDEGSNVLSTNAYVTLADQGSVGLSEYNAPGDFTAFDINAGELLGQYHLGKLSYATSGGSGIWYKYTDVIPMSSVTCTWAANRRASFYATGNTPSGGGRTPLPLINGGLINNGLISGGLIS